MVGSTNNLRPIPDAIHTVHTIHLPAMRHISVRRHTVLAWSVLTYNIMPGISAKSFNQRVLRSELSSRSLCMSEMSDNANANGSKEVTNGQGCAVPKGVKLKKETYPQNIKFGIQETGDAQPELVLGAWPASTSILKLNFISETQNGW
jgi:hypothetical protein